MHHEVDGSKSPVTVTTWGREGQIAQTTWPDLGTALEFAERMSALCGGEIVEAVA